MFSPDCPGRGGEEVIARLLWASASPSLTPAGASPSLATMAMCGGSGQPPMGGAGRAQLRHFGQQGDLLPAPTAAPLGPPDITGGQKGGPAPSESETFSHLPPGVRARAGTGAGPCLPVPLLGSHGAMLLSASCISAPGAVAHDASHSESLNLSH